MSSAEDVRVNDVLPVRSRVSWGALFAGLFVALTVYVLLGVLGAALGLSVADQFRADNVATAAGAWAIGTLLVALFSGGCVTSRCTVGETKMEAVLYGVILWGVMFALILWTSGSVLRAGFGGALHAANVVANSNNAPGDWERAAREAGLNREQIDRMRANLPTAADVKAGSTQAAWWSFAGLLVSLAASIGGAMAGAGPAPFLGRTLYRQTTVSTAGRGMHPTTH